MSRDEVPHGAGAELESHMGGDTRLVRLVGGASLAAGLVLVSVGLILTPTFAKTHFGSLSTNVMSDEQVLVILRGYRLSSICAGMVAAFLGLLVVISPTGVVRVLRSFRWLEQILERRHVYLTFCVACSAAALIFGLLVTQSGIGIGGDSGGYIEAGKSLYHGNGFGDFIHHPLYPLLIAALMHMGFAAEQAARLVPVLSFATLIFALFFLARSSSGVLAGYVACVICVILTPLLHIASYALMDMLYAALSVLAILFLTRFVVGHDSSNWLLCMSAVLVAAAALANAVGVVLIVVGFIAILIKNRRRLVKAIPQVLLFGLVSALPLIAWFYRNYLTSGSPAAAFSHREAFLSSLFGVVNWIAVDTPLGFFVPGKPVAMENVTLYRAIGGVLIGSYVLLLGVFVVRYRRKFLEHVPFMEKNAVVISYLLLYLGGLIAYSLVWALWHEARYLYVVYPFLVLMGVSTVLYVYRRTAASPAKRAICVALVVLFLSFTAFQGVNSAFYYQAAKEGLGGISPLYTVSPGPEVIWVLTNVPRSATAYSNNPWEIQHRQGSWPGVTTLQVDWLPRSGDEEGIQAFFEKLASEKGSYVIGFKEANAEGYMTNAEIAEADLSYGLLAIVADLPGATIWQARG